MRATKEQIIKIHILKTQLALSDDEYYSALESYGVSSSKELTKVQAKDLINKLQRLADGNVNTPNPSERGDVNTPYPSERGERNSIGQPLKYEEKEIVTLRQAQCDNIGQPLKYEELGIRYDETRKEYYATPKQLRLIEALWRSHPNVIDRSEKAMIKYIKRITGVDKMEWLIMSDVRKIIKAINEIKPLKNIKESKNGKS
jgi:hypothetical protein